MNEEKEEFAAELINSAWDAWVKGGGLDAVEETLGPTKEPPACHIFEAGWKLGFHRAIESFDHLASRIAELN